MDWIVECVGVSLFGLFVFVILSLIWGDDDD